MSETRPIMHRVPKYGDDGKTVMGMRYFPLVRPAEAFAKEQAMEHGHKGYTVESIPREALARLLEDHLPIPDHYTPATESTP